MKPQRKEITPKYPHSTNVTCAISWVFCSSAFAFCKHQTSCIRCLEHRKSMFILCHRLLPLWRHGAPLHSHCNAASPLPSGLCCCMSPCADVPGTHNCRHPHGPMPKENQVQDIFLRQITMLCCFFPPANVLSSGNALWVSPDILSLPTYIFF